jgi:hypothetical protein
MSWTLERIYAHCEESDGCMLWKGGMIKDRYPIAQEPAPELKRNQRQIHVRRKVYELAKGHPAPSGPRWVLVAKCGEDRCVAEGCLQLMTKGKRLHLAYEQGTLLTAAHQAKVAATRRERSKLPENGAAAIRESTEPGHVLAARHGISEGYALAIRSGARRRDHSSPFAALQAVQGRRRA